MAVVWQSGEWCLACDPDDGGRIESIRLRDRELLSQPHFPNGSFEAPAANYGLYETRPVFGYDDCWPSLRPSPWPGFDREIRDHGELCWKQWHLLEANGALSGAASDSAQGWVFRRDISVRNGDLVFAFECSNTGRCPLPMHWAGHVLVPPSSLKGLFLPEFTSAWQDYPIGSELNVETGEQVWSYLQGLPTGKSVFVVLDGVRQNEIRLCLPGLDWRWRFAGQNAPAIGLWYNRRGHPLPLELARDECGIEWMTGGICCLDEAVRHGSAITLEPGESLRWSMEWSISVNAEWRQDGDQGVQDEMALAAR